MVLKVSERDLSERKLPTVFVAIKNLEFFSIEEEEDSRYDFKFRKRGNLFLTAINLENWSLYEIVGENYAYEEVQL